MDFPMSVRFDKSDGLSSDSPKIVVYRTSGNRIVGTG